MNLKVFWRIGLQILSLAGALPRPPLSSWPSPHLPPGLPPGLPLAPLVPPPLPSLVPCDIFSNQDLTGGQCFSNRRGGALDPALLQPPWPWSFPAPLALSRSSEFQKERTNTKAKQQKVSLASKSITSWLQNTSQPSTMHLLAKTDDPIKNQTI